LFRHSDRLDAPAVASSGRIHESAADRPRGWEILFSPEAERWYLDLDDKAAEAIAAAFDQLAELGPALRRPGVGLINGSRHGHMKEARSFGGHLRALFRFDGERRGVVLAGGDKRGAWNQWYKRMVPLADKRYDKYLRLGGKGWARWPIDRSRRGERFEGRDR
jgi:hypothetical protein